MRENLFHCGLLEITVIDWLIGYRSTPYVITPWLPRRNWAGFLNWGLARRSTFHVGLMEVVDDRRRLVSGIHTTAGYFDHASLDNLFQFLTELLSLCLRKVTV